MSHLVLKPKHTLVGKGLLPMILKFKASDVPDGELARFKKDHPIENYSLEELSTEFGKLTGETLKDVMNLTGKELNLENTRHLLHQTILFANLVGAPKSSPLTESSDNSQPGPSGLSEAVRNSRSSTPTPKNSSDVSMSSDMESRLKKMEHNFDSMKQRQAEERVEEAIKNVRVLAGRPKLTSPSVLLASMEVLVECAMKAGHNDTEFYSKALQTCRQYENSSDISSLCLKLLGSSEDKKISAAVAEWIKTKNRECKSSNDTEDQKVIQTNSFVHPQPYAQFGFQPYAFPAPFAQGYPGMGPMFSAPFGAGFANRPVPRLRPRRDFKNQCYICRSSDHFASQCPDAKKK